MKLTQAILPVAGLGTRFMPWTKVVPKELLPLGNEPIIAHLVDECLAVGISEVCFVISHGKELIPEYFFSNPALEAELEHRGKLHHLETLRRYDSVRFHVVYQEEQRGDGHAILQAANWVNSPFVAILFGDDLFVQAEPGLVQLQAAFTEANGEKEGAIVALQNIPREDTARYGIVDPEWQDKQIPRLYKVKGLVEKPKPQDAPSTLGIVGRYIIPKSTFDVLPTVEGAQGKEIRLIDALIKQVHTMPIFGYECEGLRLDTGTPEGYREAVKVMG